MATAPPGPFRMMWLLARTGALRWVNRWSGQFSRKQKSKKWKANLIGKDRPHWAGRTATPRRPRVSWSLVAIVGLIYWLGILGFSFHFLGKLAYQIQLTDPAETRIAITNYAYEEMLKAEGKLTSLDPEAPPDELRNKRRESLDELERTLSIWSHMHLGNDAREERKTRAREMVETFEQRGSAAFRPVERFKAFPPEPRQLTVFTQAVGLLLLTMALTQFFLGLGMSSQDLGTVSWSFEWLFTLPVPAWVLFTAKIFEYTLVNALGWFIVLPFLIALLSSSELGWSGVPLAIGATLLLMILIASLQVLAETWLRKKLSLGRLKNLQALFTILGMLLLLGLAWAVMSPETPETFLQLARRFPLAALWNPFSLPALFGSPVLPMASGALLACSGLLSFGAAGASQRLVREGLVVTPNVHQGKRSAPKGGVRPRGWLPGGMLGKDLRLFLRDRNLLVQTFMVPVIVLAFQLVVNPAILRSAAGDFRHAAALAFGVGSYVLAFSALRALANEGNALWMIYTFPQRLDSLVFRKALLPCAVATGYALSILIIAVVGAPSFAVGALPVFVLALGGVMINAFIASALGALGTDPLETEAARRVSPMMAQLYLFIAGLYVAALYSPSLWNSCVQAVLSLVLAFALWQKVRDRLPFLLDPTDAPRPRISLADGLVAALAFFVLQGLLMLAFRMTGSPPGSALFLAFCAAGLVVGVVSLCLLVHRGAPELKETLGLTLGGRSWGRVGLTGVLAGTAAAAAGVAYLRLVDAIEPLRKLKEESMRLAASAGEVNVLWVLLLAIAAAPLFEEYLFRGLIFRGLRRSAGFASAAVLSAALFAMVHPPISAAPVFVLGIVTAWSMERTGSLLAPVLTHLVYNAAVTAAG